MGVINSRGKEGLWWGGLITGILGAGGMTFFVVCVVDEVFRDSGLLTWLDIIVCGLLVFGSVYVAWKRPRTGGVMLITSNVVVLVVNSILDFQSGAKFAGIFTLLLGIPSGVVLLISSIIFLSLWRTRRKQRSLESS